MIRVSWCDSLSCSITLRQKQLNNCNLQRGGRKEGGRDGKQQVDAKSTANSGWCSGAVTVNLFTHKAEPLAHLDNTVNSNEDPVISNYRPWAAVVRGWGVTREQQFIDNVCSYAGLSYLSTCFIERMCTAEGRPSLGDCLVNHWVQVTLIQLHSTGSPSYLQHTASNLTTLEIKSLHGKSWWVRWTKVFQKWEKTPQKDDFLCAF